LGSLAGLLFLPLGAGFSAPLLFTANLTNHIRRKGQLNQIGHEHGSATGVERGRGKLDGSIGGRGLLTWFRPWRRPWIWPPSWLAGSCVE
jgi:hypothetical protein